MMVELLEEQEQDGWALLPRRQSVDYFAPASGFPLDSQLEPVKLLLLVSAGVGGNNGYDWEGLRSWWSTSFSSIGVAATCIWFKKKKINFFMVADKKKSEKQRYKSLNFELSWIFRTWVTKHPVWFRIQIQVSIKNLRKIGLSFGFK